MLKQRILVLTLYCFFGLASCQQLFRKLNHFSLIQTLYYWKQLSYDFDGVTYTNETALRWTPEGVYFKEEELEEEDIFFKPYSNVPYGFDVFPNKTFYAVPRKQYGIPSTLNFYKHKRYNATSRLKQRYDLKPYPDVDSIPSLVSVYRPRLDECRRLWVVDTGLLEVPNHHKQLKPPEIIVFNLLNDTEILRYQLKPSDLFNGTTFGLTSITVDVTNKTCDDAYAYIPDSANGGLIVFSMRERDSWRFTHPTFNYDAGASFVSREHTYDWKVGITSIALSDPDAAGVRTAYYHPFLSTQEFSIATDILKDKDGDIEKNFKVVGIRGPLSQSGIHVYHSPTRNLLFANIAQSGIMCWNVDKPLNPKNTALIAQHSWWLAFVTDMKVIGQYLYMMMNSLDTYVYSKLNTQNYNFLLYYVKIPDLIKGTVCDGQNSNSKKMSGRPASSKL